tara:strand:- start:862 stop:1299 length:438 start_codon:yes stop_codon:yes gene_type:complete
MIIRQYFILILIANLFVLQFKKLFAQDPLLYTCEYKSTKYVNHKIYGNDSHFLNEYTKTLGWIKITNTDVRLSGIGWSQGMSFSSISMDTKLIKINFQSKFNDKVMRSSKIIIDRSNDTLKEYFYSKSNQKSEKFNNYDCLLNKE